MHFQCCHRYKDCFCVFDFCFWFIFHFAEKLVQLTSQQEWIDTDYVKKNTDLSFMHPRCAYRCMEMSKSEITGMVCGDLVNRFAVCYLDKTNFVNYMLKNDFDFT